MALLFDEETRSHLSILINAESPVLVDFCKLALDYIRNGPNPKRYQMAAQKLETSTQEIENAVTVLVKLLIDGCKYSLTPEGFAESMVGAGFSVEAGAVLGKLFSSRGAELSSALGTLSSHTAHSSYRDLHWRLQAQVASRSVTEQIRPAVILSLHLSGAPNNAEGPATEDPLAPSAPSRAPLALQTSLPTLVHLTSQLEGALRDSRTFNIRRMQRVLEQ